MIRNHLKSLRAAVTCLVLVAAYLPGVARAQGGAEQNPRPGRLAAAADTVAQFSGRAFGAQVKVLVPVPDTRLYADTGLLASAGGSISASLAAVSDAVLTSGPTSCSSQGGSNLATSAAAMANVSAFAGTGAALSCTNVQSSTRAACDALTGSTQISGLVFAGVSVVVTGAANQTVSIPGVATLVINEQIFAAGSITVNALRLSLATGDELTLCSTHSDIHCSPTPTRRGTWGAVKAIYR